MTNLIGRSFLAEPCSDRFALALLMFHLFHVSDERILQTPSAATNRYPPGPDTRTPAGD